VAIGISFRKISRGIRRGIKRGLRIAPGLVMPLASFPGVPGFPGGGGGGEAAAPTEDAPAEEYYAAPDVEGFRLRRRKKKRRKPAARRAASASPRGDDEQENPLSSPRRGGENQGGDEPPDDDDESEDSMGGSVMGDVMGEDEVVGYDMNGEEIIGRRKRRRAGGGGQMIKVPPKPAWRNQLAPGVPMPGQGQQPLPLRPNLNAGVFTAAFQAISFEARPQVPFKPQRYVTTVRRTGAAGVIIQATSMFVGRDLQLVELGNFDIEQYSPTAFDMTLSLSQAEPGVLISIPCVAVPAVAGADTVAVSMQFIGYSIV
jgi:hypothetical protein